MKRGMENLSIAVALSVVGSVLMLNWLTNDDATKSFLVHVAVEHRVTGIKHIEVAFDENAIFLNVDLTHPMQCEEVISVLGIEDLPIKGRVYTPMCTTVKSELVVITYKERRMT